MEKNNDLTYKLLHVRTTFGGDGEKYQICKSGVCIGIIECKWHEYQYGNGLTEAGESNRLMWHAIAPDGESSWELSSKEAVDWLDSQRRGNDCMADE